jgi:pyruvate dehydrogenase E2 component (dihydrolipoamide acetyltransferase)
MEHEIVMPHLSPNIEEGVVATWFVDVGARVRKDQLIAEVQVEKTAVEIESPVDGTVKAILVPSQGVARQGAVIGIVEE